MKHQVIALLLWKTIYVPLNQHVNIFISTIMLVILKKNFFILFFTNFLFFIIYALNL